MQQGEIVFLEFPCKLTQSVLGSLHPCLIPPC